MAYISMYVFFMSNESANLWEQVFYFYVWLFVIVRFEFGLFSRKHNWHKISSASLALSSFIRLHMFWFCQILTSYTIRNNWTSKANDRPVHETESRDQLSITKKKSIKLTKTYLKTIAVMKGMPPETRYQTAGCSIIYKHHGLQWNLWGLIVADCIG